MGHRLRKLYSSRYFFLGIFVVATLAMHLSIIAKTPDLVFDENHYVPEALHIIESHRITEPIQPPLGKLFIVTGISALGDNPWGWRIFSVIAGTVSLVLFFFICRRLQMSLLASNLATFLLAFENMTFVQAGIAMLDVYYYMFLLAAFLLYLSRRYVFSGVSVGLSMLAKLSGAFAVPVIGLHWLFSRGRRSWRALLILVLAAAAFLVLLPLFDYAVTRQFVNPLDRIGDMLRLTGNMTFATVHDATATRPWDWVINYWPLAYLYMPHYYGGISPTIWVLILPSALYLAYRAFRGNKAALFGISWFLGTYVLWLPLSAITGRLSFVYYFYPAIGAVCLGIGLGLGELLERYRRRGPSLVNNSLVGLVVAFLVIHLVLFMLISPVTNIVSWKMLPW